MIFDTDSTEINMGDAYSNLVNIMGAAGTTGTTITTTTPPNISSMWDTVSASPSTLKFQIEDEEIVFEEQEIVYLKEMLTDWIKEHRPESLL